MIITTVIKVAANSQAYADPELSALCELTRGPTVAHKADTLPTVPVLPRIISTIIMNSLISERSGTSLYQNMPFFYLIFCWCQYLIIFLPKWK